MGNEVRIASVSELPSEGEAKEFTVGETVICVANVRGTCTAMDNVCVHRGGPLGQGVIDNHGKLVCPWHGWQFDVKTGKSSQNPELGVKVYPLKIVGEDVIVEI